jgi:hypothetical protein
MQAKRLITYHSFCLLSFETHGITSVARLQREEVSRAKKEHGGTGTFSTGIYGRLACFVEFSFGCKLHGNARNLLEVLHLSKYTANLIEFGKN